MLKSIRVVALGLLLCSLALQAQETEQKPRYVQEMEQVLSSSARMAVAATQKSGGFVPFVLFFPKGDDQGKILQLPAHMVGGHDVDTLSALLANQAREYARQQPEQSVVSLSRTFHAKADNGEEVPGFLIFVDHRESPAGLLYFIPLLQRSEKEYYLGEPVQQGTSERIFR